MKTFQIEFYFDQGNTIVLTAHAEDKASALRNIPTHGTFEITDQDNDRLYRITITQVKYIMVYEL